MLGTYDITVFFKDGSWTKVYFVLAKDTQDGIRQAKERVAKENKEIDCYSFRKA